MVARSRCSPPSPPRIKQGPSPDASWSPQGGRQIRQCVCQDNSKILTTVPNDRVMMSLAAEYALGANGRGRSCAGRQAAGGRLTVSRLLDLRLGLPDPPAAHSAPAAHVHPSRYAKVVVSELEK